MKTVLIKFSFLFFMSISTIAFTQSSYLTTGGKEECLLNRMDILTNSRELSFSSSKPYNLKAIVNQVDYYDSLYNNKDKATKQFSEIDKYNMQRFLMSCSEWSKPKEIYKSEKKLLKYFYDNRANMFEQKEKDYHFIVNPIFNYQIGSKADATKSTFINQRGLKLRGTIDNKIGFYFYFTENQERQPLYVLSWKNKYIAFPGGGYVKTFKTDGYDYFDPRGGLSWKLNKYIDMQLAYDKNFIGNGYRSLLLSDFGMNYMFLKMKYNFGKFRYENIFAELVSARKDGVDRVFPRKYFRASYLNYQLAKSIHIGLFEGMILGNKSCISLPLFNPIMFTSISGDENDRKYFGGDVKINVLKKMQLYGQALVYRLDFTQLKNNWWNNRYAYQLGAKYINAFEIKNLDLQAETNFVRPFMYANADSSGSYNHYNQPLAHPLGANFNEYVGIIKYQPIKKLYLQTKVIYYSQGLDSTVAGVAQNYGSNIFSFVQTRPFDYGFTTPTGNVANCVLFNFVASYELKENLFVDFSLLNRSYQVQSTSTNTNVFSFGLRWNIGRKEYLF